METKIKYVYRKMFLLGKPQRIVARIRKKCTKCRRIMLMTVELKMAKHAVEKSIIATLLYTI